MAFNGDSNRVLCCSVSPTFMEFCLWRAHRWTHWLHSRDLYYVDTPSSRIGKKDTFLYTLSGIFFLFFFYWNCEISPCCFTPSFIVGYLWSSAQGVATSCSLSTFQVLSDDKRLPSLALAVNLHVILCVSFPRCNTFFCVLHASLFQLKPLGSDAFVRLGTSSTTKREHLHSSAPFSFCTDYKIIIAAETFNHAGSEERKLRTSHPGLNTANNAPTLTRQITSQWVIWLAAVRDVQ